MINGCGTDAKLEGKFVRSKHAALAQTIKATLEVVGHTNHEDFCV